MFYKIKQLKNRTDYLFMSWDWAKEYGFNLKDYGVVYEGNLPGASTDTIKAIFKALDTLFEIFNVRRPEDFKGHSLSMSDIVEINGVDYYCDSVGWQKVE